MSAYFDDRKVGALRLDQKRNEGKEEIDRERERQIIRRGCRTAEYIVQIQIRLTFNTHIWNLCLLWMFVSVKNILWTNLFTCAFFIPSPSFAPTHLLHHSFYLPANPSFLKIFTLSIFLLHFFTCFHAHITCEFVSIRVEMPSLYLEKRAFYLLCSKFIYIYFTQ